MEVFKEVMNYVNIAITIILTIIYLIFSKTKNKKVKSSNGFMQLLEKVPILIETAETMFEGKGKGNAKLDYVLTQLQLFALQNNITYDLESLKQYVNNLVETTKHVNVYDIKPLPTAANINDNKVD